MATKAKVRDDVVYYVDQGDGTVKGYLGTKPFVGGGGGTIENAALTNLQFDYTSTHDPITVFQTAGVPAYYGGIPARLIVQGQPVLFNVPYEDIKPEDTTSDYTYVSVSGGNKGDEMRYVLDITEVTATTVTVEIKAYDVTTGTWNSSYSTTSTFKVEDLSECSFGICRNCTKITRASTAYQKKGISYSISGSYKYMRDGTSLGTNAGMYVVGFQSGSPMVPKSSSGTISPTIYGFSDDEWFYNTGLAQRYEVIE